MRKTARQSLWKETFHFSLGHWRASILFLTPAAVLFRSFNLPPVLVFLVAAVPASLNLVDPAIRRHNPEVRAQATIVSGPVGINNINLSPMPGSTLVEKPNSISATPMERKQVPLVERVRGYRPIPTALRRLALAKASTECV